MATDPQFELLTTCADPMEAGVVRSRVEEVGIQVLVLGEQHNAVMGMLTSGLVELQVLVPAGSLQRARRALESDDGEPLAFTRGPGATVCAEHGGEATGTCGRCGKFVCDACAAGTPQALLCASCEERLLEEMPRPRTRRRVIALTMLFIFLGGPALLILVYRIITAIVGAE